MPLGIITAPTPIPYGTTISLMARIRGLNGALITQTTVDTVTYLLWNMTTDARVMPASGTRSLVVSSVIYNSLQMNTALWSADGPDVLGADSRHGYNFKYDVPATDTASTESLAILRATCTFTFSDSSVLVQLFDWSVADAN